MHKLAIFHIYLKENIYPWVNEMIEQLADNKNARCIWMVIRIF